MQVTVGGQMATPTSPNYLQEHAATETPEQALCAIFDLVEDALQKLTPENRKAWLDDLSETAERLERQP